MKNFKTICITLLLSFLLSISQPSPAHAFLDFLFGKKDQEIGIDSYPIHDAASFAALTTIKEMVPFDKEELSFTIPIPTDWDEDEIAPIKTVGTSQEILTDIARFKSPMIGISRAIITVQSIHLLREVTAKDWLKNYISTNGYAQVGEIAEKSDTKAYASFRATFNGKNIHTYTTVHINGNIAMIARFDIPLELGPPLEYLLQHSIDGFKLKTINTTPIEKEESFTLVDALKIYYPASWTLADQDIRDSEKMSVQFHNKGAGKHINGMIRFIAVQRHRKTSLMKEVDHVKKYLEGFMGVQFSALLSSTKEEAAERFKFTRHEIYNVGSKRNNAIDQELHLVVLGDKYWYIFAILLTPSAEDEHHIWSINRRAFELMIKNAR